MRIRSDNCESCGIEGGWDHIKKSKFKYRRAYTDSHEKTYLCEDCFDRIVKYIEHEATKWRMAEYYKACGVPEDKMP